MENIDAENWETNVEMPVTFKTEFFKNEIWLSIITCDTNVNWLPSMEAYKRAVIITQVIIDWADPTKIKHLIKSYPLRDSEARYPSEYATNNWKMAMQVKGWVYTEDKEKDRIFYSKEKPDQIELFGLTKLSWKAQLEGFGYAPP
jgi:hypothetical protein